MHHPKFGRGVLGRVSVFEGEFADLGINVVGLRDSGYDGQRARERDRGRFPHRTLQDGQPQFRAEIAPVIYVKNYMSDKIAKVLAPHRRVRCLLSTRESAHQ